MFGVYDLAVISVVEDFSLGSQIFRPFNSFLLLDEAKETGYGYKNYNYQVLSGTLPEFHLDEKGTAQHLLCSNGLKDTVFSGSEADRRMHEADNREWKEDSFKPDYPFIAISKLKLNNLLVIGTGELLIEAVCISVQEYIEKNNPSVKAILVKSFSCHEITLTLFSKSNYASLAKIMKDIREWSFIDLFKCNRKKHQKLRQTLNDLASKSSGFSVIKSYAKEDKVTYEKSHVFVNTNTMFGYHANYLNNISELKRELGKKENVTPPNFIAKQFTTQWDIKPGHLNLAKKVISDYLVENEIKGFAIDLITMRAGQGVIIPTKPYSINQLNIPIDILTKSELHKHLRQVKTDIDFVFSEPIDRNCDDGGHPYFNRFITNEPFSFRLSEIEDIRKQLHELFMFRVLRERVLHMFVNYNNGMDDPILFGYFIELKGFLNNIVKSISDIHSANGSLRIEDRLSPNSDLHKQFEDATGLFDRAFANRFRQSYRMLEMTDYTLEYNGGIQQLISGLDAAYKAISVYMGEDYRFPSSFAYVSGHYGVTSDIYSVKLNYFHAFQLEIFAMVATHESSNGLTTNYHRLKAKAYHPDMYWNHGTNVTAKLHGNRDTVVSTVLAQRYSSELYEGFKDKSTDSTWHGNYVASELQDAKDELERALVLENSDRNVLASFDDELLRYVVSDMVTLTMAYNFDIEMFTYFHWSYYLQMTHMYNKDGGIAERPFIPYLIRLVVCQKMYYERFYGPLYNFDETECNSQLDGARNQRAPNFQTQPLWDKYHIKVWHYVENTFFKTSGVEDFLRLVERLVKVIVAREVSEVKQLKSVISGGDSDADFDKSLLELRAETKEKFNLGQASSEVFRDNKTKLVYDFWSSDENLSYMFDDYSMAKLNKYVQLRRKIVQKYSTQLTNEIQQGVTSGPRTLEISDNAENISIKKEREALDSLSPARRSIFIHSLFLGYLSIIKQKNGNKLNVLYRNPFDENMGNSSSNEMNRKKGDIVDFYQDTESWADVLIDPVGGIFTHNSRFRRDLFKMRSAMINSLWHFAQLSKYHLMKELADKSKKD
jgi:hypothetical protein